MKDIWVPLSAAIAQQRKVDTIANNVANANTPGFKKDRLVFKEYLTALDKGTEDIDLPRKEWRPGDFYRSQGAEKSFVKVGANFTVHEQGQLTPTGNPFDLGISGPGFLEVLTPNGIRYTRRGSFSISKEGKLVTDQGYLVLSKLSQAPTDSQGRDDGASLVPKPEDRAIIIPASIKNVSVTNDGTMYIDGQGSSTLSVVEFNDVHALRKEGSSLYINPDNNNLLTASPKTQIHQGFVEQSNVNAVEEMSELIKANRQFESVQRAIKTYDNISGRAVNDILRF